MFPGDARPCQHGGAVFENPVAQSHACGPGKRQRLSDRRRCRRRVARRIDHLPEFPAHLADDGLVRRDHRNAERERKRHDAGVQPARSRDEDGPAALEKRRHQPVGYAFVKPCNLLSVIVQLCPDVCGKRVLRQSACKDEPGLRHRGRDERLPGQFLLHPASQFAKH